jgi:hypothetical protein
MSKVLHLDEHTKEQAIDYANAEADLHGFPVGSSKWKEAFRKHVGYAVGTMSLGRNPRGRNPRDEANWAEVFGASGFVGKVASNFKGKRGEKPSAKEIAERVKSAVSALVYLYMNGIYGIKTTTEVSTSGKIKNSEMSDLQLHGAEGEEGITADDARAENIDVVFNQLAMTVVETAAYEFLLPFLTMPKSDVDAILDKISVEGTASSKDMAKYRTETEARIKRAIGDKLKGLSFKKLVLGSD